MVALVVVGREELCRHLACGRQRGIEHCTIMFGVTLALEQGLGIEKFVQQKLKIAFVEQHKSESRRE
ncbi:hypothetical protein D3C84_1134240 [compost metagenome]